MRRRALVDDLRTLPLGQERNLIFVPETYTSSPTAVPLGDQNFTAGSGSPTVGQLICGSTDGCIAVYVHRVKEEQEGQDR